MSVENACGCGGCGGGGGPTTPRRVANRPGLGEIRTRVGTHADFLETMLARLTSHALPDGGRPLQRLSARDPADPSIALLDAWAVVADVLTFYQERIANEGYLGTATERRSVLELGRLVGYRLRPGVAASAYLAYTLEPGYDVTIPAGSLARSLPGPGENAEPFETAAALEARAAWGMLRPRRTRPYALVPPAAGEAVTAWLKGADTGLQANQMVLVAPSLGGPVQALTVRSATVDREADLTTITLVDHQAPEPPPAPALKRSVTPGALNPLGAAYESVIRPPSVQPPSQYHLARVPAQIYSDAADLAPQLLATFNPGARDALFAAYANTRVTLDSPYSAPVIEALRVSAVPFGATAPLEFITHADGTIERREWPLAEQHAALGIEVQSTLTREDGGAGAVTVPFNYPVDIEAGGAAPLNLSLRVWDRMSVPRQGHFALTDFTEAGAHQGEKILRANLDGVLVTMTARYQRGAFVWFLAAIEVRWHSVAGNITNTVTFGPDPGGDTTVLAANAGPRLFVTFDFSGETAPPVTATAQLARVQGGDGSAATVRLSQDAATLSILQTENQFAGTPEAARILSLDAEYDTIVPGSRLVVTGPLLGRQVHDVLDVHHAVRTDYGLSQKVTLLLLDRPWLSGDEATLADIRSVTIHGGNEVLDLAEAPIGDDVGGDLIELDGLYEGLTAGRWLAIGGERTDVPDAGGAPVTGIMGTELAMLAGVEHRPAQGTDANGSPFELPEERLHTRLILAKPLAYRYKRETATINANVIPATHGETRREVLGGGDSAARLQQFNLAAKPLTHLAAVTPKGTESTLEVRVDDILWREVDSLFPLGPAARNYQTRTDNDGKVTLTFGDGAHGARLPSGTGNVSARYRTGIGAAGNVGRAKISVLGPRALGVKAVSNPVAASGGADPESRDQARLRVPLATRALDRLVSVTDYTDFATLYAGIGKAAAARLPSGGGEVIHLTLAGAADAPLDERAELWRNLRRALFEFGDPSRPVVMAQREAVYVFLRARIKVLPDYLWDKVEPVLRARLLGRFGFEARALGQPMRLSELVAVMQKVEGVDYVDVDLFDAISASDAATPQALADKLAGFSAPPASAPRNSLPASAAYRDGRGFRPAQLVCFTPDLPDTLILTEVTV